MNFTVKDHLGKILLSAPLEKENIISPSILNLAKNKIIISYSVPIKDIAGYFIPSSYNGPTPKLDWVINFQGYSSSNMPFVAFIDQSSINRYAFYLDNLTDDFTFSASMNQQTGTYDVTWTMANSVNQETPLRLFFDDNHAPLYVITKTMRERIAPKQISFPKNAYDPVYCTWYAVHACLTNEYLDENARLAAELGCGTFIVDDGWCYDEMKRVNPKTICNWYCDIGDWRLSEKKLPDFKKHIEKAQQMGLKYLLWVAPYFCFENSDFYKSLAKETDFENGKWSTNIIDVRNKKITDSILKRMEAIVRDLKLDGLKVDFLDNAIGSVDNPIGRASLEFIKNLSEIIRHEAGSDALIEFRQSYATPQMLPYATQFRAGDVPFDYLANLSRIATARLLVGSRVPVHADPLYWHYDELPLTVARHMIASLAGVPMLSMDLGTVNPEHLKIIRHYLDLYNNHKETFASGEWEISFGETRPRYLSVYDKTTRITIIVEAPYLSETDDSKRDHIVLNLSSSPLNLPLAFEADGTPLLQGSLVPPGGHGLIPRKPSKL